MRLNPLRPHLTPFPHGHPAERQLSGIAPPGTHVSFSCISPRATRCGQGRGDRRAKVHRRHAIHQASSTMCRCQYRNRTCLPAPKAAKALFRKAAPPRRSSAQSRRLSACSARCLRPQSQGRFSPPSPLPLSRRLPQTAERPPIEPHVRQLPHVAKVEHIPPPLLRRNRE